MEKIFICGHKNPDTDSVASAKAYAYLKSKIDKDSEFVPIRAGNANDQTKYIFQKARVELPEFMKDIYPKVRDNMSTEVISVFENDPISRILKFICEKGIRFTPVVDKNNNYKGMAGVHELTELFVRDDRNIKPVFTLRADSLQRSLKADVLNKGQFEEFDASIIVATMAYESFQSHVSAVADEKRTILIIGNRQNILNDVLKKDYPAIVLVGIKKEDYSKININGFKGWVFASPFDSAQTIRCVEMATPVKKLMSQTAPAAPTDYMSDISERLSQSVTKSLPVVENEKLIGIITSTDVIRQKKQKLILMDHNELTQAIDGVENSEIVEIIDHHKLGTIRTNTPVYFYAKPVGSTCTLVYQLFKMHSVALPKEIATILLGGVLSDTVIMKSPTTTAEDRAAIEELAKLVGVDAKEFGVEIFSSSDSLGSKTPKEILGTDFKIFEEFGLRLGISQVETVTLRELDELKPAILSELEASARANGLAWNMILVTDIIKEESVLITTGFEKAERLFAYKKIADKTFFLPNVLSRKKQLVPEVLRVLEEMGK